MESLLKLKREIEEMSGESITGWTLLELGVFSRDLYNDYYDLTGARVDKLMSIMREHNIGVVPEKAV